EITYTVPTIAVKITAWMDQFFKDIRRLDKSAFSLTTGFRAAAFVIAPLIVGFAIKQPDLLSASLGANVLTNTERVLPTIPSRILLVACFTEAASFGLGTLVATTSHLLSPLLLGIAIFAALIAWASTKWAAVGTFTAIIFANIYLGQVEVESIDSDAKLITDLISLELMTGKRILETCPFILIPLEW
ncbi:MAG: hypothetical protein WA364_14255, partial [Candidatus Nitrosopolaris sp.]